MRRLAVGVALVALLAVGCGESASELKGTSWVFAGYEIGSGEVAPLSGTEAPLAFEDTTVSGSDGCNTFTGGYEISEGNMISIGPLAGTLMACEPAVMEQATTINTLLTEAILYEKVDDRLIMRTQDARYIAYDRADS